MSDGLQELDRDDAGRLSKRGSNLAFPAPSEKGFAAKRVLLVGTSDLASEAATEAAKYPQQMYVVGAVDSQARLNWRSRHPNIPVLGSLQQVASVVCECCVDEILEALPEDSRRTALPYLETTAKALGTTLTSCLRQPTPLASGSRSSDDIAFVVLRQEHASTRGAGRFVKRFIDILVSASALLLLSPLLAVIAAAIKLTSPGPVFFRQQRVGFRRRQFGMLKFRTMKKNAEELRLRIREHNNARGISFKVFDDPRVTRVGSILRRSSVDELPQLINVLKGEMSLVGPRPIPVWVAEQMYGSEHVRRFSVQQGLTGLWQVEGRQQDFDYMAMQDLRYADNWRLALDLKIILRTLPAMIREKARINAGPFNMKQHVCLITPPSMFLLDERVFMSLGILRVAAVLEQQGIAVEMLDLSGVANFEDAVRDHATFSRAKIFGLTATSPQMPAALKVRDAIQAVRPDARIILGGPHVTLVNAARKRLDTATGGRAAQAFERLASSFDVLVAGDGEDAIFQAIADDSPKLVDADDPRISMFLTPSRLDTLPFPARHLIDAESYHYTIDGVRAMSLICQFGCPFGCRFCGGRDSPSLRRVRLRSVESVVAELTHLHDTYGVTGFMLYDDELNVNPKMTELMRAIAQRARDLGVEFRLRGFIKAELLTEQQAEAMYEAGFRWILTGFESGSPRILRNINKRATLEDNTRCVEIAHRQGMKVKALMSAGHPGESEQTVRETYNWLMEVRPDDFDMTIISVYPGSPYYDEAVKRPDLENVWVYTTNGDRLYSYDLDFTLVADYYKGDPEAGYKSYVYTDYLTAQDLVALRNFVESDVRHKLAIPFNPSAPAIRYEHSMGQMGSLPEYILRATTPSAMAAAVGSGAGNLVTIQEQQNRALGSSDPAR